MPNSRPNQSAKKPPLFKGTGTLVNEIQVESIHAKPDISVTHENLTTLTSYNLLDKNRKTMIVPGSPPMWAPKPLPVNIRQDSGKSISDPACHVFPGRALEPLFRALFTTRPDFTLKGTDLVSDRRNLRLLLDFASGNSTEFRIDVEVVGETILFSRWAKSPVRFLNVFGGYGHEFENAFTRYQKSMRGSISHNRAISYTLGGVNLIMRFEVDGYIEGTLPTATIPTLGVYTGPTHAVMTSNNTDKTPTGYTVLVRGHFVPPSRTIEIKTCSMGKNPLSKAMAQMWFSQTPIICGGQYAERGVFSSVTTTDITEKLATWEKDNTEKLRRLVRVIEMICEAVKKIPGGKCSLIHTGGSKVLGVYSSTNASSRGLPEDILARLAV